MKKKVLGTCLLLITYSFTGPFQPQEKSALFSYLSVSQGTPQKVTCINRLPTLHQSG